MKKILFLILIIISLNAYSQVDNSNLQNEVSFEFEFSETEMQCILVNETDFRYLIWISENEKSNLTNNELVREHFFKNKGDFSLYNIATESLINLDNFSLADCEVFTKVLNHQDTLNIILKKDNENSNLQIADFKEFINNRLVVLSEKEIERKIIDDLDKILFKDSEYFINKNCLEKIINE